MSTSQALGQYTRDLWPKVRALLPTLARDQKQAVYDEMQGSSRASVDFYVLIVLSSLIAYFGLIQDSETAIIGAMLVAPLMSPMMAMAFGIVMGRFQMFRKALTSSTIGIGLVVGMSALITLILPSPEEYLGTQVAARTQPALLDLAIALLAGAAGAYALSRKQVAAALPGVAISAALVPPLCVVGLGVGLGDQTIARGALLLFLTNLASVLFAGSLVFLVLGFGPRHGEQAERTRRRVLFTIIGVLIVAIPLSVSTVHATRQRHFQATVEDVMRTSIDAEVGEVGQISVRSAENGYEVLFSVYAFDEERLPAVLEGAEGQIRAASQDPVTIRARIIRSSLSDLGTGPSNAEQSP